MSLEQKLTIKENYLENRNRVFEIYGLDPKNRQYNCHHIVTKHDQKAGNINKIFCIDAKSNLYPLRTALHKILNDIIEAVDSNKDMDIRPLIARWNKVEDDFNKPIKIKSKTIPKPTKYESLSVVFYDEKINGFVIRNPILSPRSENTVFAQKLLEEELVGLQELFLHNDNS